MTMPTIPRILTTTALCLAALGLSSCCHPSVEERGPVLAFSFQQNGRLDKSYYFSEDAPYPRELRDWIEYNNGKFYYTTIVTYAPVGINLCFPAQHLHFSFLDNMVYDGSNYRSLTPKDKEFLDWLKSLPWMSNQSPESYPNSWLYRGSPTISHRKR